MVRLNHLALPVRDVTRATAFYAAYFGFDPDAARQYEDGTVILRDADAFALALHPGERDIPIAAFLHFGFELPDAAQVQALLARMQADGVEVVERYDESGYVGFKCLDPEGHRVEVYWEPT